MKQRYKQFATHTCLRGRRVLVMGWLQSQEAWRPNPEQVHRQHGSAQLSAGKLVMEKQTSAAQFDLQKLLEEKTA